MSKQRVEWTEHYAAVMKSLTNPGALVGTYDSFNRANLMTIGWGAIGSIWGIPVWIVLVRPSRHTFQCIEHSQCFTVNVATEDMRGACAICGSKSGRDVDKVKETGLGIERATTVLAPAVVQSPIVYECQVVHSNDVLPAKLAGEINAGSYINGDYHRVFYGKILATRAEPNASQLLR